MSAATMNTEPSLVCPTIRCRCANPPEARVCASCGTPLEEYGRLSTYPDRLFNLGLAAARSGSTSRARDLFAAVVHWCPHDLEARNALALACFLLGDVAGARDQWAIVLGRAAANPLAKRGLEKLDASSSKAERAKSRGSRKRRRKRRRAKRK